MVVSDLTWIFPTTPSRGPAAVAHLPLRAAAVAPSRLSKREVTVLQLVAMGRSNKEIAVELGISHKTVRNHMSAVFIKSGASNRTEAVLYALRSGFLEI